MQIPHYNFFHTDLIKNVISGNTLNKMFVFILLQITWGRIILGKYLHQGQQKAKTVKQHLLLSKD